jgi:hypothetical protein
MLPASFLDQTIYTEVSSDTWRAVLDAAGENARLGGEVITPERLLKSLMDDMPGGELLAALEVVVEFGTESGREQFQQAADDAQVALGAIDDIPSRELVARIWVDSHTNTALALVLVRVRANFREAAQARPCREFAGKHPIAGAIDKIMLEEAISAWCRENKKNESVTVFAYRRGDEWWYEVFRGDPLKRVVEIKNDGAPGILHYRPAASDLLRYDPITGRLAVATRSTRLLQVYRQVVGKLLKNESAFFASENICTLKPLQERGRDLFRYLPPGILRVDVTELRWRRGDRDKILIQGRDCFQIIEELRIRLSEGQLIEAKLSIIFAGAARPGSVSIKVPNRIDINAGAHEPIVEKLLDEVHIRGPFAVGQSPPTLWSLFPGREKMATWRNCTAIDFDSLFTQKIMRSVGLLTATSPGHPFAPGALAVTTAGSNLLLGVSEDPAVGVRGLTRSDVEGYELDAQQLVKQVQTDLLLEWRGRELDSGIWFVGTRVLTDIITICVFTLLREPSADTERLIRTAAQGTHAVLMIPNDCDCTLDIAKISFRLHGGNYGELLPRMILQLGLQSSLPLNLWSRVPLLIDEDSGRAWYKDVELTKLQPGSHPFRFAALVAREKGKAVSTRDLNATLSSTRDDSSTAKTAKMDFIKAIKASYKAVDCDVPADVGTIIVACQGGYRLNVDALVLPLVPVASRWPERGLVATA